MDKFKSGNIISGPFWKEPVELNIIEKEGNYYRIVGVTQFSKTHIDQYLSSEDVSKITIINDNIYFSENPHKVFLALETIRYRFASLYDPLLAMNTSKIDPLPHQIEAVYGHVLKIPRIRFMIADDPGAGKTIMAGLIIKELKIRGLIKRILIVLPGHLKDQWRREMKERFEERFTIIDRGLIDSLYGENVWLKENQIITSIDFAKRDDIIPSLEVSHFDLIIVDEAHKMSAYQYGNKISKSKRYKLGETLSHSTTHFLFLTATPHKGDSENFRLFLDLLEPGFFSTSDMLQQSIENKDNPLFIRRIKEDLKNFEGEPLFLPRYVKTLSYNLGTDSPNEKILYNELSKYVVQQYNKALTGSDKKRNIAFALVILQRRLASSTYALLRSLERRKKKLEDLLLGSFEEKEINNKIFDFDEIEDLSEEERWKNEEIWETLSVAENREELEKEIVTLENLSDKAKDIISKDEEIKLRQLKDTLDELNRKFPEEKIIIFTEAKDTLSYLEKRAIKWGYKINTIHGGMKLEDRVKAESIFKNETQLLIATEAAGEGINLQFCHLMINYDIPWNPNRLEQRMGRIHRYGQTKEVFIFNLVAADTREGIVLNRIFEKIEEIKNALGSDKVFDVISEVLIGKNLSHLLLEASMNTRSKEEILKELDIVVDEEYIAKIKDNLGDTLATRFIDYTRIKEMRDKAEEYRLIPEYTEAFFKKAFKIAKGNINQRKDGFLSIESIPYEIKSISYEDNFKKSYGTILTRYRKSTFDKNTAFNNPDAEFITFGHPLFETVLVWIERSMSESLIKGATFSDPDGQLDGNIIFYEGEIKDGNGNIAGKRLFSFYYDNKTNEINSVNPAIIWDLLPLEDYENDSKLDIEKIKKEMIGFALYSLEKYKKELLLERERQAHIKEKYGKKSLDYLIVKLDGDLIDLQTRKENGENVELVIRNKQEQKKRYEQALKTLEKNIIYEKTLNISSPKYLGAIKVIPDKKLKITMKRDDEIEKIGMKTAMEFEKQKGRIPEDVSKENIGFDIRSSKQTEKGNIIERYIEVKARAKTGDIAITQNEMFKAHRFKDKYYLYVVSNAGTKPELQIIQNPAENLKDIKKIESVRFIVSYDEIVKKKLIEPN